MENFRFCVGTDIRFGRGQLASLPELLGTFGKNILLTYGGGSIHRTGLYEKIKSILKDFNLYELSGIEPNPKLESIVQGKELCLKYQIDAILAVGGGSTIDCSKVIAAAACSDEDPWQLVLHSDHIKKALPLVTVLTLAATGSEMNRGAVITNQVTKEKLAALSYALLPKASVLDPELTYTVSPVQTAAGAADIFSHIIEQYFTGYNAFISDGICETILKTVIHYAPVAMKEPENYEARSQLMWASTIGLNTLCGLGKPCVWSCHPIEHEISAYYDITHGVGLAIVTPRWFRFILNENTLSKFVQYGVNVWNIDRTTDDWAIAEEAIALTEKFFFAVLNLPSSLHELKIDDTYFDQMAKHAAIHANLINAYVPLSVEDVKTILTACL